MLFLYNIILVLLLILFSPLLFVKAIVTPKYRGRVLQRLGLAQQPKAHNRPGPRIWVHGLSVGEVTSALPMVTTLRKTFPASFILFSTTTMSGDRHARATLHELVDRFVDFPFDLPAVVNRFLDTLAPDIFVLVETDFWPNLLNLMQKRNIPSVLVNGRISSRSFRRYQLLSFFFSPLFQNFSIMAMQTQRDADKLTLLGVNPQRIKVLGNLKYDAYMGLPPAQASTDGRQGNTSILEPLPNTRIIVAGSTHGGEEEMLLAVLQSLRSRFPRLLLILAPRQPERGDAVRQVALMHDCTVRLRTELTDNILPEGLDVVVLDTIGELAGIYGLADLAFVGGSLVPRGGHNPLEPALYGKPVLFGPHMEDFGEIALDLLAAHGAIQCDTVDTLSDAMADLLAEPKKRRQMGQQARDLINLHRGGAARHVTMIAAVLEQAAKARATRP